MWRFRYFFNQANPRKLPLMRCLLSQIVKSAFLQTPVSSSQINRIFFLSMKFLKYNTQQTVELLKSELEIRRDELKEKILFSSLEKIFIENRIYRDIEEAESWEEVISKIDKGLKPHKKKFYREITTDDIVRLTEIKIKRISKFDSFKANEQLRDLEKELKETEHHLKHLTDYAIAYYQKLLDKYGKGRERKTEIKSFQSVTATEVIANNQKLYVNRTDGFVGYGLEERRIDLRLL